MAAPRISFKLRDAARLATAARNAGLRVVGMTLENDGRVTLTIADVPALAVELAGSVIGDPPRRTRATSAEPAE